MPTDPVGIDAGEPAVTGTFGVPPAREPDGTATGPPSVDADIDYSTRPFPTLPGYEITEFVARGGMGLVYKARQLATNRTVAIKTILSGEFAGAATRDRFQAEAEATAHLSHPNIVQLFEAGEFAGQAFLVCEFVPGGSLAARLDGTPWEGKRAAQMIVALARAVAHAHAAGVVHRDLKPANVLLAADGAPKVADFGIAKRLDAGTDGHTHTGAILGTPSYMAPEQAGGAKQAAPAADVYSLGAMLYELITGRPPFKGADAIETIDQLRTREPVPPHVLQPRLARDLETICLKCLRKEPARRYESADDLADDLTRFLECRPILARPVSAPERAWRWCRRNKAVAAALATVVLLLTLLATGGLLAAAHFDRQSREQRQLASRNEQLATERGLLADEANAARAREEERATELRRSLYRAEMNLAGQAAAAPGGVGRVGELLGKWRLGRPDVRGWEWYYLHGIGHRDLLTLRGHADRAVAVAWSKDGRRLASAGWDGAIRVWDAETGIELRTIRGGTDELYAVAWDPSGKHLAGAGREGVIRLWDTETGSERRALKGHNGAVFALAWSPDGKWLASGGLDRSVRAWNPDGEEQHVLFGHGDRVVSVAWDRDSKRVASVSWDKSVRLWNTTGAKQLTWIGAHTERATNVTWSPDGKRLASASEDQSLKVFDADLPRELRTMRILADHPLAVAWSPDGKWLATGNWDGPIRIWDDGSGTLSHVLRGHAGGVSAVAWDPTGKRLASAGWDGTVRVWDPSGGTDAARFRWHNKAVAAVAWEPTGTRLASAGADRSVKVGEPGDAEPLTVQTFGQNSYAVAWHPAGTHVVSGGDGGVIISECAGEGTGSVLRGHADRVTGVAYSPDGKWIVSGGWDRTVRVWNADAKTEDRVLTGHADRVTGVAWSPDGKWIASASEDQTVRVWSAIDRRPPRVLRGHSGAVNSVAWSSDGTRLASGSDDRTVRVWGAATGAEVVVLRGHTHRVGPVAWSPLGGRLASAGWDRTVKLWDPAAGTETLTIRAHAEAIMSVAWDAGGNRLASASDDWNVLIHDATTGQTADRAPAVLPLLDRRLAADPNDAAALRLRAETRAHSGDWDGAAKDARQVLALSAGRTVPALVAGCWVVGPYPANPDAAYPPEQTTDPLRPVAGTGSDAERDWSLSAPDPNGFVAFDSLLAGAGPATAYALLRVYSPEQQRLAVLVCGVGPVRLWLNGQRVFNEPLGTPTAPARATVPVALVSGWNTILVRVVHRLDGSALFVRLSGEQPGAEAVVDRSDPGFVRSPAALLARGELDEAEQALADALAKQPNDSTLRGMAFQLFTQRIDAATRKRDWAAVAASNDRLLAIAPESHWLWYRSAALHANLGNRDKYQQACREMLERFGSTKDPMIAERTAKACLLLPGVIDLKKPAELAELAVTVQPKHTYMNYFRLCKALSEVRGGRFAEAVPELEKLSDPKPGPYIAAPSLFLLAIAQHQNGQAQVAQDTLNRARDAVKLFPMPDRAPGALVDWLVVEVLQREAEERIEGKKPGPKG